MIHDLTETEDKIVIDHCESNHNKNTNKNTEKNKSSQPRLSRSNWEVVPKMSQLRGVRLICNEDLLPYDPIEWDDPGDLQNWT